MMEKRLRKISNDSGWIARKVVEKNNYELKTRQDFEIVWLICESCFRQPFDLLYSDKLNVLAAVDGKGSVFDSESQRGYRNLEFTANNEQRRMKVHNTQMVCAVHGDIQHWNEICSIEDRMYYTEKIPYAEIVSDTITITCTPIAHICIKEYPKIMHITYLYQNTDTDKYRHAYAHNSLLYTEQHEHWTHTHTQICIKHKRPYLGGFTTWIWHGLITFGKW